MTYICQLKRPTCRMHNGDKHKGYQQQETAAGGEKVMDAIQFQHQVDLVLSTWGFGEHFQFCRLYLTFNRSIKSCLNTSDCCFRTVKWQISRLDVRQRCPEFSLRCQILPYRRYDITFVFLLQKLFTSTAPSHNPQSVFEVYSLALCGLFTLRSGLIFPCCVEDKLFFRLWDRVCEVLLLFG